MSSEKKTNEKSLYLSDFLPSNIISELYENFDGLNIIKEKDSNVNKYLY